MSCPNFTYTDLNLATADSGEKKANLNFILTDMRKIVTWAVSQTEFTL